MASNGLFELDETIYTIKLNMKKAKMIEKMLGISFVREIAGSEGMLSFNMLEAIFAVGLYDAKDEKAVKGEKASGIFNKLLEDIGYSDVVQVVIAKVEEDLGFLFR